MPRKYSRKDYTGEVKGIYKVIEVVDYRENCGKSSCRLVMECSECGRTHLTHPNTLREGLGNHLSICICYRQDPNWSQEIESAIHRRITNAIKRCHEDWHQSYRNYGGRGITVCDEWRNDFGKFYRWSMANGFSPELELDRIDNNGPYSPENCRWVTRKENIRNTRVNRLVEINGETLCLIEAVEKYSSTPYRTVKSRINCRGWDPVKAILTPPLKSGRRKQ